MGIIAEFGMAPAEFVLGDVLVLPEVQCIEFECVVPARTSQSPFFWVWGTDFDAVEDVLCADSAIGDVEPVNTFEDGRLYRTEWREYVPALLRAIRASDGRILSAAGDETGWGLEIRFPDKDALERFSARCKDDDLALTMNSLLTLSPPDPDTAYGLTPKQREILVTAADLGYFDEPRTSSLEDVADELGISAPSASGRLRRATAHLIEATVDE
jgi:predicted DNA binding protein